MIITQGSTQPLVALHGQPAVDVPIPREQQDIALALVIALGMVVFDIFLEGPSQRTLAKEDHLGQALLLHRPDPALGIGIQVRAAGRQHERFDLTHASTDENFSKLQGFIPLGRDSKRDGINTCSFLVGRD